MAESDAHNDGLDGMITSEPIQIDQYESIDVSDLLPDPDPLLAALKQRQEENKTRERKNNSSLPAGSPMYFDCSSCQGEIKVPETYTIVPKLCPKCQELKDLGLIS